MSNPKQLVKSKPVGLTFNSLVASIGTVHAQLAAEAGRAVNVSLTLRNWLIGCWIARYELAGTDRAKYGQKLLTRLSTKLINSGVSRTEERELRRYHQFYQTYPQIRESLTPELKMRLPQSRQKGRKPIRESVTPELGLAASELISKLSFTHIAELLQCDTSVARAFYETECALGNWSVRELKRQMGSLYFERSSLSRKPVKLAAKLKDRAHQQDHSFTVRDPYVFEFLGLESREVMGESHLEDQLLDKLEHFLLELGHGFCFEARQKRILIGDAHGFVDLVFYHRVLKCHVLIELKLEAFSHQNIGQLNTYVTWYRKNVMTKDDNPPIGLLLCAQKDQTLAEYALAGMDNKLFVSKYQLHLPDREQLQRQLALALQAEMVSCKTKPIPYSSRSKNKPKSIT